MVKPIADPWHNQVTVMGTRKTAFDRKFGDDFIASVPRVPGVYQVFDAAGTTIYVGKAKNLRRRLQQYRNARRCNVHHKMRAIVAEGASIRWHLCENDLAALLLENELIQKLRPKLNIAGAFSFLYPVIGLIRQGSSLYLCYTTTPTEFPMFSLFGAFRSRQATREAFNALIEILSYLGHQEPSKSLGSLPKARFSRIAGFRQVSPQWDPWIEQFLRGESPALLERAALALLEKPSARRRAGEIQEFLRALKRFYRWEAKPLRQAMLNVGLTGNAVSQRERDGIFLRSRHRVS